MCSVINYNISNDNFLLTIIQNKIDIKYLQEYDFFEIYDENKTYEKNNYYANYKGEEKKYRNVLYLVNIVYNSKLDENEDTYKKRNITKFIVAKEVYNREELIELKKYCKCYNCKELEKYNKLTIFEIINDFIINFIIYILKILSFNDLANKLKLYLNANYTDIKYDDCINFDDLYIPNINIKKAKENQLNYKLNKLNKIKTGIDKIKEKIKKID
jgi:hypothetical protein